MLPMTLKDRLILIVILAVAGAALYFALVQPPVSKIPKRIRSQIPDLRPAMPPPPELPPLEIPALPALVPPLLPPVEKK